MCNLTIQKKYFMTEQTNYLKIRVFIPKTPSDELVRTEGNQFIGTPKFKELVYNANEKFREPIITFINDAIGTHNWAIIFTQFDESAKWFDAELYCQDEPHALKMVSIIKERITDIKFNWFYRGDISKYIVR